MHYNEQKLKSELQKNGVRISLEDSKNLKNKIATLAAVQLAALTISIKK